MSLRCTPQVKIYEKVKVQGAPRGVYLSGAGESALVPEYRKAAGASMVYAHSDEEVKVALAALEKYRSEPSVSLEVNRRVLWAMYMFDYLHLGELDADTRATVVGQALKSPDVKLRGSKRLVPDGKSYMDWEPKEVGQEPPEQWVEFTRKYVTCLHARATCGRCSF